MRDPTRATTVGALPGRTSRKKRASRLVQVAPGPETPDTRDRSGARRGMIIMIAAGAVFWGAVAAVVALLAA